MEIVGKLPWAAALALCFVSPATGQSSGIARPHDPVVIDGSRAARLHGSNVARLVAFRWQAGWVQVPLQVDQRFEVPYQTVFQGYNVNTALTVLSYADPDTFTGADPDPFFDADDELAFMASGAGERAPLLAAPPAGTLAGTGLELLLTDPLDGAVGYAYVFQSDGSLSSSAGQDAVSYQFNLLGGPYKQNYATWGGGNPEDSVVTTPFYRVHFSERWVRDEVELFASGASGLDVLDRHRYSQAPAVCNRTEDSFSDGVGAFFANIDGPVRAIRSYMGANSGPLTQRVHTFYAQREDVAMIYRVHAIGRAGLDLFDYRPGATGMKYSNSLNPAPVPIDGVPEPMAEGDLEWELVDGPHGSLIHAHRVASDFPTTVSSYYSDYVTPPMPPCSGDASEYGASGSYGVSPLENTDPRNSPTYNYVKERTVYYGAPGQDAATAGLRTAQASAPLQVGARDFAAAGDLATYCTGSTTTCGEPSIGATGVPLASASSGFVITVENVRANKPGILLYTDAGAASIPWSYGTLCVNQPRRAPAQQSTGTPNQCDGVLTLDMNAFAAGVLGGDPKAFLKIPGTQVNCQWWGRNTAQGGSYLSNALKYVVQAAPAPVDVELSTVIVLPAKNVIANGIADATIQVTLRDTFGNPVVGKSVQIGVSGASNTVLQPIGPTDANGRTTGTVASFKAEAKTITAMVSPGGVVLAAHPTVRFVGDPATIDLLLSSATATPASVLANGAATATVTVTVRDAHGNAVPGRKVAISASGGNNTLTQPLGPTDAAGVATAFVASTLAQTKTITAVVDPQASPVILAQQPTVLFSRDPSTINATLSSAVATPGAGVVANGVAKATITVTVRDAFGNPVPGQMVQLAATGSGNTLLQPTQSTDASGQATGTLATYIAEPKQITVTINPQGSAVVLDDVPAVVFVGDPATIQPGLSSAQAVPSAGILANGVAQSTVTVTVRDANNNPVAGQSVQFSATGAGNTLGQPGTTNVNGVASGTIASTVAGTKTITVTVNPQGTPVVLSTQPTVAFVANPGTISASLSGAVATPASGVVANGTTLSTVTVTVRDSFGNPVAGQTVQLAATGTGNALVQPAGPTNASGIASGTLASTKAETKTLTVTVNPQGTAVVLNQQPTVVFVPGAPHAGFSSVGAVPSTGVLANGSASSTVTVTVRDANNNPIAGKTVQLAATGTGNALVQPAGPTNASGIAIGTLSSTKAETKTLTATVDPQGTPVVLGTHPTVAFVADPSTISASLSGAVATPASGVPANGSATSTVTVTVRDAFGNPVAGQTVQLAATGTGNALVQPAGPTNASGIASGTLASTKAETKTLTATVNPQGAAVVLNQHPTVTFDSIGPVVGSVLPAFGTAQGGSLVTVNGSGYQSGSPGATAVTFGGVTATDITVVSDQQLTCRTPAGAHGAQVDVVVSNANGSGSLVKGFRFNDPPTIGSVAEQFGDVGALYAFQVSANDPDPAEVLTFTSVGIALPGWAALNPATGVISGTPQSGMHGTTNGHKIAVSDGFHAPVSSNAFALTVAAAPAVLAFAVPPASVEVCGATWNTFSVRIEDAYGNRVGTATNVVQVKRKAGTGSISGNLLKSAVAGIATFGGLSYNQAEPITIDVTAAGLTGLLGIPMDVMPGPAVQLAWYVSPAAIAQVDTVQSYFAAELRDVCGNRVTTDNSTQIQLTVQSGLGSLSGTLTRTVAAGLAVFEDLRYDRVETVVFQATSLPTTTVLASPVVDVRAAPALQAIGRSSVTSAGAQSNDTSTAPAISGDGRYVAFESLASNLVPGDTNAKRDVFVRDRVAGTTSRVSVDTAGNQANGDSFAPALSDDGRFVAFHSTATNLVGGDTNATSDVFVHDRALGLTKRVSLSAGGLQGNGASSAPAISAAGRFVAFESVANNLVAGDTNARRDVFVRDLLFGTSARVSVGPAGVEANGDSQMADIAGDGSCVAFSSLATNLAAGDTNAQSDVFVHVLASAQTTRVSVTSAGAQANALSQLPSLSFDAGVVAFESIASNLVSGDSNGTSDVFVHVRSSGQTTRVSVSSGGAQGNASSTGPALSADGLSVAFRSTASNLVCGDSSIVDLFVYRRLTGATACVTPGGNLDSSLGALSANGRSIAVASLASNLVSGDTNAKEDVFVAGELILDTRISTSSDDAEDRTSSTTLTSEDLELGNGDSNDAEGMRFINIPIPRGATIHEAWIEFLVDEVSTGSALLLIEGHDVDDAPVFTTSNGNITSRARTSAKVVWNPPSWSTVGQKKTTPDLSTILQELVDRPGWTSCNDLVIIVTGTGSRVAESYDGTSSGAPLLHVAYTP